MSTLIADQRLWELERRLRPGQSDCPFVIRDADPGAFTLNHFDGGRDATYVLVSRANTNNARRQHNVASIGYAPFVDGTTLIYDVSDAALQGKARPFKCDLTKKHQRLFVLLPSQIESLRIAKERKGNERELHVSFLDAQGEPLEAALPFRTFFQNNSGLPPPGPTTGYWSTNRDGRFAAPLQSGGPRCVVRSLVTGRESAIDWPPVR